MGWAWPVVAPGLGNRSWVGRKDRRQWVGPVLAEYIPVIDDPTSGPMTGSRMTTDSDLRTDVMLEGTQRGTPRKRALFGPGCLGIESPIDDVSPRVELADTVARLQREVEDLRSESMYNRTGKTTIPPQHSSWVRFTSTRAGADPGGAGGPGPPFQKI